jgi:hypothetical protein
MILSGALAAKRALLYSKLNISFYKWEVLFPLLCFALVFGMRYGVGDDHLNYLNNYITGEGWDSYELGFRWITNLFAENNFHYTDYFGTLAFLQVFFFFYAFKDERYLFPYLAFLLFAGGYFLAWMNGIRQDLAACIFIYSIKFIDQKKVWKYLLWCTIAFLFHKSEIILVLIYPLFKNGRDYFRSIPLQLIILSVVLGIYYSDFRIENFFSSQIELFASWLQYENYTMDRITNMTTEVNTGIGFLLAVIIDIVIILYGNILKEYFNSKRFVIIYNLFFVGTITRIIFVGSGILLRPFRYFIYFELIAAGYLIYYLFKHAKPSFNQIVFFLIIGIYLLLFAATLYRGETNTAKFLFFWQV